MGPRRDSSRTAIRRRSSASRRNFSSYTQPGRWNGLASVGAIGVTTGSEDTATIIGGTSTGRRPPSPKMKTPRADARGVPEGSGSLLLQEAFCLLKGANSFLGADHQRLDEFGKDAQSGDSQIARGLQRVTIVKIYYCWSSPTRMRRSARGSHRLSEACTRT